MNTVVNLLPGATVECGGKRYTITQSLDLETVLCRERASGRFERLSIASLSPVNEQGRGDAERNLELALVSEEKWQEAHRRFEIILPLLNTKGRTRRNVKQQAEAAGVGVATLYRWINAYEEGGRVSALIPTKQNGGCGKSRLRPEVEAILKATIEDFYLHKQRRTSQKTCEEVLRRCRNANVIAPHPNTVKRRMASLSEKECLEHRFGSRLAREKYAPLGGHFPGADHPLSVVQIDHTKVDLILVDDIHREPIGRPWITLAIDVFSRMVCGFYISFDPPGGMSAGLCISHSILPKEKWLARHNITAAWPCWGVMKTLHMDNAKEFRGEMLKRACQQYGIDIKWRPVATPHYGGHIERLMGTFAEEIHTLPGTTFSNPIEKGSYDSERMAAVTLNEFETWLATFITGVYHQRVHNTLQTSPIGKYEQGIFGTKDAPGRGLPARTTDEDSLRLDFMPYVERSIQQYGVVIDGIHYYSDVLRRYINVPDLNNRHRKRSFIFKRDPRDISVIYFYDPEVKQYSGVPYRDTSRPAMSIWELRQVARQLKGGRKEINEALIFESYERMQVQEQEAVRETKRVRRENQRRLLHRQSTKPAMIGPAELSTPKESRASLSEILPFEEMEELD